LGWLQHFIERNRRLRELWSTVPAGSVALFMGFAFCLFATVGALAQLNVRLDSLGLIWIFPVLTGTFAAALAWSGVRGNLLQTAVIFAVFFAVIFLTQAYIGKHGATAMTAPGTAARWTTISSWAAILFTSSAWPLALTFFNREGQRFFQDRTEMRLAGEIHQALVPAIESCFGDYEFYGISQPSGMVGGDLVDVLASDGRWLAYVVDVSGHGVSSGVLMAMIKSSIHTALRFQPRADGLLEEVNRVLCSLKATNMFATCGLIAFSPEHGLRYALAGHLPILRLRDRKIEMLSESNLPLGIVSDSRFSATACEMLKGDILVVVTDGLTEMAGKDGEEHGFRWISQALIEHGARPAREIATEILKAVNQRGTRNDDQSLLIVRRIA
jgi:hypothetical protein